MIAKKTGHCQTIARVRNPIYHGEIAFLKKEFGLAMIINPELTYPWPGNVRELKQTIQTAVLQAQNDTITVDDLEIGSEQTTFPTSFTLRNDEEDKERILRALKQAKGNKKLAAKMLGIGRSTLYNKLDEYGLNEEN